MGLDCGSNVDFVGKDNIQLYDSSPWAKRGFCIHCGTHLFYKLNDKNKYILPVGIFENADDLKLSYQVFIDEKPSYYCFSNETYNMTGKEILDKFLA